MRLRIQPLLVLLGPACDGDPPAVVPDREPCAHHEPLRSLWWGDLHVHTAASFDAWTYDIRVEAEDAWAFAKGETVMLPPLDASGAGTRPARLDRPLDFAALTDHAEYLGEVSACTDPTSPAWDAQPCQDYREANAQAVRRFGVLLSDPEPQRFAEICEGAVDCLGLATSAWRRARDAAEAAYDRSADCSFTALHGYEWSGTPNVANHHRNVIFRSSKVPGTPTSYFEEPTARGLWQALERDCRGDCAVLAIPHNTNASNGQLFQLDVPVDADPAAEAAFRARMEPLIEVYQHKADSECRDGLSGILGEPDEQCAFEKWRRGPVEDCGDTPGAGGLTANGCVHRLDFLRGILLEGLRYELDLGVNPFTLGVIASTDTHSGTPGLVREQDYRGHLGNVEDDVSERLAEPGLNPGGIVNSPGGLVAVWAEENSREAIFDALSRREVYGTSGPRIPVRFFGGVDLDPDLCQDPDWLEKVDAAAVPMGGRLAADGAPSFLVHALADPGTATFPGQSLERIQIIKGWIDDQGDARIEVIDVAGEAGVGGVDPDTCDLMDGGAASLCAMWTDPDWDADAPTFYYARVLEAPTCRWSWRDCLSLPEDERPGTCWDETPRFVQERAWTSPIQVRGS
ncbi:MAG: DUF3604 domain-containing protein [Alphaproteobacteria bacterium]|nr:DUF3604 domain-containing protein [Alphaproteobacteria bacterium]